MVLQNENVMIPKGKREPLKVLEKKGVNAETIIKGVYRGRGRGRSWME